MPRRRRTAKVNLKMLFDGYCRNFANVYDDKFTWTEKEGRTWLTHSILRFFRNLGESMGFDITLDKQVIGDTKLKSKGDMLWIKSERPVLHLECENADVFWQITEELENLGSSSIPFKVGVFQCTDESLNRQIIRKALRFLVQKELVNPHTRWLLIFDFWTDIELENVEYSFTDPETKEDKREEHTLEYYPLMGIVLDRGTVERKSAKVYCLPLDKIGVIEGKWEREDHDFWA